MFEYVLFDLIFISFIEYCFPKYWCILLLWLRESFCIWMWPIYLRYLPLIILLLLSLFLQLLESINWFYYCLEWSVPWAIDCWLGNIGHVVVFTLMNRNTNWSTPCWKDTVSSNISYLTKGWSKLSFLSIVRESSINNQLTVLFQIYCFVHQIWQMNNLLGIWIPILYCFSDISITYDRSLFCMAI